LIEKLQIELFLSKSKGNLVIDVRSPSEYNHAHIPGAINIPLFTDEERKIVGTAYKQESRENAIKIGLDFFGPKMKPIVEFVEGYESQIANSKSQIEDSKSEIRNPQSAIFLYCWRGGMRSGAIAWLLDLYGFKVYQLTGGYKSYRRHVLDSFKHPYQFNILGGYTGSAKTETLHHLEEKKQVVIDLEGLAKHKGSAFGNIGMPEQPGQEMFENLLFEELSSKKDCVPIWLEDESQRIGHVNLPNEIWNTMRTSPVFFLDIPFEERLQHIVSEYGKLDKNRLIEAIGRIREKLGPQNAKAAVDLLDSGNTIESFRILLEYYDKFYRKALHNRKSLNSLLHSIECKSISPENAEQLIQYRPASKLQQA
jgi:tRNA 2-selenouridine synthase